MKDSFFAILLIITFFGALPVLVLSGWAKLRALRRRRTPEQIEASALAYRERLLNPHPDEVEKAIGGLLPQRLIASYKDHELILSKRLELRSPKLGPKEVGEWIDAFLPLDYENQSYTCDLELLASAKGFCFAGDGCGNFYWVPLCETRQPDAPVFFACHDPWGNEKVAESLEEFLSWPRFSHKKSFVELQRNQRVR